MIGIIAADHGDAKGMVPIGDKRDGMGERLPFAKCDGDG
jgi:hypothetical protein